MRLAADTARLHRLPRGKTVKVLASAPLPFPVNRACRATPCQTTPSHAAPAEPHPTEPRPATPRLPGRTGPDHA